LIAVWLTTWYEETEDRRQDKVLVVLDRCLSYEEMIRGETRSWLCWTGVSNKKERKIVDRCMLSGIQGMGACVRSCERSTSESNRTE